MEVTNHVGADHDMGEWLTKGDGVFVGFHTRGNILTVSKDLRVCVCHGTHVEIRRQLGRVGSLLPLFGSSSGLVEDVPFSHPSPGARNSHWP